jgi:hypothetical protein
MTAQENLKLVCDIKGHQKIAEKLARCRFRRKKRQ